MTGLEIFIGGGILLSNLALASWLLKDKNAPAQPHRKANEEAKPSHDDSPIAAASSFDLDSYMQSLSEKVLEELPKLITVALGEVDFSDVVFSGKTSVDKEENVSGEQEKTPALNKQATAEAFDTDIRDVEPQPPSEPIEPCPSIDELEESVEVAMDPASSDEEKAKAGKVLQEYEVTQVYDVLKSKDVIGDKIDLCLKLALRAEISAKAKPKSTPKPAAKNTATKTVKKKVTKLYLSNVDFDNFNPEDVLPQ